MIPAFRFHASLHPGNMPLPPQETVRIRESCSASERFDQVIDKRVAFGDSFAPAVEVPNFSVVVPSADAAPFRIWPSPQPWSL